MNWKSLEAADIDKNTPVSAARLRNVKFSKRGTSIILDSVGGGANTLTLTRLSEGVITISTVKDAIKNTVTRVYDIRDLILTLPDNTPEKPALA